MKHLADSARGKKEKSYVSSLIQASPPELMRQQPLKSQWNNIPGRSPSHQDLSLYHTTFNSVPVTTPPSPQKLAPLPPLITYTHPNLNLSQGIKQEGIKIPNKQPPKRNLENKASRQFHEKKEIEHTKARDNYGDLSKGGVGWMDRIK